MIEMQFSLKNKSGRVHVTVETTHTPNVLAADPGAVGLPNCTATIDYDGLGYNRLMGWIQFVRSTDNESEGREFEIDPFDSFKLYNRAPTPYAFFGIAPTLFDAPARDERVALDWIAHSFLAWSPFQGQQNTVTALGGFSWGFEIGADGTIQLKETRVLASTDWSSHLAYLRKTYSDWEFNNADDGRWSITSER